MLDFFIILGTIRFAILDRVHFSNHFQEKKHPPTPPPEKQKEKQS